LLVSKKRDLEDTGCPTFEEAREKREKIGKFDFMKAFALKGLGIRAMFHESVPKCKKWR
jgi:hypothetical protein